MNCNNVCPVCGKLAAWNSYFKGWVCECGNIERRENTNADRIRAMSDEKLAEIIMCPYDVDIAICEHKDGCFSCCLNWLQQPAEESTT